MQQHIQDRSKNAVFQQYCRFTQLSGWWWDHPGSKTQDTWSFLHRHQGQSNNKVWLGCLALIAALASGVNSIKRCWKHCHQFTSIEGVNITAHVATTWTKILEKRERVKSSPAIILHSGATGISPLDSAQIWTRFLAAGSSNQGHILLQSRSLWNQGTSKVISTLHRNGQLLGKLCVNQGWLNHPPRDRLDLTLCSAHNSCAQQFTHSYQIV